MSQAAPLVKYAEAAGIPCILFVDCDKQGRNDQSKLPESAIRIWATGDENVDGTLEEVLVELSEAWVLEQCERLLPAVTGTALERLKQLKGTYGGPIGRAFVDRFPDEAGWPRGLQHLVNALRESLDPTDATVDLPSEFADGGQEGSPGEGTP